MDYLIKYVHCECNVWPVAMLVPMHRCGRCRVRPFSGFFDTKELAEKAFREWKKDRSRS